VRGQVLWLELSLLGLLRVLWLRALWLLAAWELLSGWWWACGLKLMCGLVLGRVSSLRALWLLVLLGSASSWALWRTFYGTCVFVFFGCLR
jgi:hypothetical protein